MSSSRAIPLIQVNKEGKLEVQPEGAKVLSDIRGQIVVVVVTGPYRTGLIRHRLTLGMKRCVASGVLPIFFSVLVWRSVKAQSITELAFDALVQARATC